MTPMLAMRHRTCATAGALTIAPTMAMTRRSGQPGRRLWRIWQHWTLVMGRAQQMLMEFWAEQPEERPADADVLARRRRFGFGDQAAPADPMALMTAGAQAWAKGLETWGKVLGGVTAAPARGRAGTQGPPLRRARMARESDLRHRSARPICWSPTSCSARSTRSRARRGDAREAALRDHAASSMR